MESEPGQHKSPLIGSPERLTSLPRRALVHAGALRFSSDARLLYLPRDSCAFSDRCCRSTCSDAYKVTTGEKWL